MAVIKETLRFLISVLAPVILVLAGAGMIGLGFENEWNWLVWTGLATGLAGLIWGIVYMLFFAATPFSFFD